MAANFSDRAYVAESSDLRLSSHFKARRLKRSGCVLTWIAEVNENQAPAADPSEVRLTLFNPPSTPPLPVHTHALRLALTKRRRKTRKFNKAFERQDYLRRRRRCYAASEISCALLSLCSHHIPPSFAILSLPLPGLAKDSPKKAHQNLALMPRQAINPSSPRL